MNSWIAINLTTVERSVQIASAVSELVKMSFLVEKKREIRIYIVLPSNSFDQLKWKTVDLEIIEYYLQWKYLNIPNMNDIPKYKKKAPL